MLIDTYMQSGDLECLKKDLKICQEDIATWNVTIVGLIQFDFNEKGLIVFYLEILGCAKSALYKELLNAQGGLEDDMRIHSLMGDLIKRRYWANVVDEWKKKPYSILIVDKNVSNEEV